MTIIESDQSQDTRLTQITRGPFILRFASYRKSADAKISLRSEDYIVSSLSPDRAIFSLSDGVGSSFYGDIGAQILGEVLLKWCSNLDNQFVLNTTKSLTSGWLDQLTESLKRELDGSVQLATSIVNDKDLENTDKLTKIAEEDQRDQFGSQSNFVAGIIWPKSVELPKGLVLLFWLGNARIRIFKEANDITSLTGWGKNPAQLKEVWSSKEGVIGKIYSYTTNLTNISSLIAYSDGLENVEEKIRPDINAGQLEALVTDAQSTKDDDVSFLEIRFTQPNAALLKDEIALRLREHLSKPVIKVGDENIYKEQIFQLMRKNEELSKENKILSQKIKGNQKYYIFGMIIMSILSLAFGCFGGYFTGHYVAVNEMLSLPTPRPLIIKELCPTPVPSQTPTLTATITTTPGLDANLQITLTPTPNIFNP